MRKNPELSRFEDKGYFLELCFDGEEKSTVLFIADKDFKSLKTLAEKPETDWTEFREEIFELLEHSGHDKDHTLSKESSNYLQNYIAEFDAEIDDETD